MRAQPIQQSDQRGRSFALVFDIGDEVHETLTRFANGNGIVSAHFTAVGAFRHAVLAYWDWSTKEYRDQVVDEQVECASLTGNIALAPGGDGLNIHMHAVIGMPDGSARAGHVKKAHVRPTLELFLTETATTLRRQTDERTGLALIEPN